MGVSCGRSVVKGLPGRRTGLLLDSEEYIAFVVFPVFVAGSALTVMNMLIGVLCEVVSLTSAQEKEEADVLQMKRHILVMLRAKDVDGKK